MQAIDRLPQSWRSAHVAPYLPNRMRVLDVACTADALFRHHPYLRGGLGIDPAGASGQ
jgi:hypothetical protein